MLRGRNPLRAGGRHWLPCNRHPASQRAGTKPRRIPTCSHPPRRKCNVSEVSNTRHTETHRETTIASGWTEQAPGTQSHLRTASQAPAVRPRSDPPGDTGQCHNRRPVPRRCRAGAVWYRGESRERPQTSFRRGGMTWGLRRTGMCTSRYRPAGSRVCSQRMVLFEALCCARGVFAFRVSRKHRLGLDVVPNPILPCGLGSPPPGCMCTTAGLRCKNSHISKARRSQSLTPFLRSESPMGKWGRGGVSGGIPLNGMAPMGRSERS